MPCTMSTRNPSGSLRVTRWPPPGSPMGATALAPGRAAKAARSAAEATLKAMHAAVLSLAPLPDVVLVDAFRIPALPMAQRGVIKGDRQCAAIAAASIVAKVTRDRLMDRLHADDPRYGFDRHKGYATADHLSAVARYGYSAVHRRSFRPPTLFDTLEAEIC